MFFHQPVDGGRQTVLLSSCLEGKKGGRGLYRLHSKGKKVAFLLIKGKENYLRKSKKGGKVKSVESNGLSAGKESEEIF